MPTTHEPNPQETQPRSSGGQGARDLPAWKRFFRESPAEEVVGGIALVVIFVGVLLRITVFGDAARTEVGPRVLTGAVYFLALVGMLISARRRLRTGHHLQFAASLLACLCACYFLGVAIFSRGI